MWYVHFEKKYFYDYWEKLKAATLEQMGYAGGKTTLTLQYNLICNGSFVYGSKFYRYWDERFQVVGNKCVFRNRDDKEASNPQIWTNLIASPAGGHKYVFSFWCRVHEPSLLDKHGMVAVIRTYDKRNGLTYSDCKKEEKIYLDENQRLCNDWQKVTFEFEVEEKYFACGLAIACFGNIEYKDLSCYRTDISDTEKIAKSVLEIEMM